MDNRTNKQAVSRKQSGYALISSETGMNMVMHTQECLSPGVGDYEIEKSKSKQMTKSPQATIGKTVRFARQQSIVSYKSQLPVCYGQNTTPSTSQMGTMGNASRFQNNKYEVQTPGVGHYNIAGFKCISKACESTFDLGNFKGLKLI